MRGRFGEAGGDSIGSKSTLTLFPLVRDTGLDVRDESNVQPELEASLLSSSSLDGARHLLLLLLIISMITKTIEHGSAFVLMFGGKLSSDFILVWSPGLQRLKILK